MPRSEMTLTFKDMQALADLLRNQPKNLSAAANAVTDGSRTNLYRLISRTNALLGNENLSWREGTKFKLPVEARRLAMAAEEMREKLASARNYPVISAGRASAVLVRAAIEQLPDAKQRPTIHPKTFRSEEAVTAIQNDLIDLAIMHEDSFRYLKGRAVGTSLLLDKLNTIQLVHWRAVIVSPNEARGKGLTAPCWEPGGHAYFLAQKMEHTLNSTKHAGINVASYAEAIWRARHGEPIQFAIPDIYLTSDDQQALRVDSTNIEGKLLGVFRASETDRLTSIFSPEIWARKSSQ